MIGDIGIYISFITAIAAAIFYLLSVYGRPVALRVSRYAFFVHTAAAAVASVYLLYALLGHKFQYYYVYAYTELELHTMYLVSAFWAGQEGTILLWALIGAVIGVIIIKKEKQLEAPVMTFISAGQFFLLLFLVVESPFRLLPGIPADGAGLNPLLIDPWMVVHPPIIFVGYALFLVPYAMAAAALWKRDYQGWVKKALPWTLLGWLFLGAGIFIGGYWAYRVLGWGGYWSWDPVENASLVPWLTGAALVHGMLVQVRKGRLVRTNVVLSVVTFVLILYATFLTRSGVLADFSVHSFAETPLTYYLVAFMLFFLLLGLGLFIYRFREMGPPGNGEEENLFSRYGVFIAGITALLFSAGFVALGTSSPAITSLMGQPATVDESFYVLTNTPMAIICLLLLGLVPYLFWKNEPASVVMRRALPAGAFGVAGIVLAAILGVGEPVSLLFIFAAAFALAAGIQGTYLALRGGGLKISGGHLAHAGVALMLLGVIASMGYSSSEIVSMGRGESREALGYKLTYAEWKHRHDEENGDNVFVVEIERGAEHLVAEPRMYFAGREPRLMREPYVKRYWWGDLYLSPMELQEKKPGLGMVFTSGERRVIRGMEVVFKGFDLPAHGMEIDIGAILDIKMGGEQLTVVPRMFREEGDGSWSNEPKDTPDGGYVVMESVNPEQGEAFLRFVSPFDDGAVRDTLIVELSRKPLIPVLAAGTMLIMAGNLIATWRRFKEKGKGEERR